MQSWKLRASLVRFPSSIIFETFVGLLRVTDVQPGREDPPASLALASGPAGRIVGMISPERPSNVLLGNSGRPDARRT